MDPIKKPLGYGKPTALALAVIAALATTITAGPQQIIYDMISLDPGGETGVFKPVCTAHSTLTGVSRNPFTARGHTILCRDDANTTLLYNHQSCHYVAMPTQPSGASDWDPNYFKAECGFGEYAAGASQTRDGHVNEVLCCSSARPDLLAANHASCARLALDGIRNAIQTPTSSGDWDVNFYKAECGDGNYAAGVSVTAGGYAQPHAVLCCAEPEPCAITPTAPGCIDTGGGCGGLSECLDGSCRRHCPIGQ